MAHSVPSSYTGESVRSAICRLYGQRSDVPLTVLHATVPPVTASLVQQCSSVLDAILDCIHDQLYPKHSAVGENADTRSFAITNHWLLSVPESLRFDEAAVVNYLGMMVAIDFCHWAEVPCKAGRTTTASVGEEVTGFAGFYVAVDPPSGESALRNGGTTDSAAVAELFTELSSAVPKELGTLPTAPAAAPTVLRGSAAMMYLLRRAVEVYHVPWFRPDFLQRFRGDTAAAMSALRLCFLGCEQDGITPLWMPCTRERVELLLSLADAFVAHQTSYYELLRACGGFLFAPDAAAAATAPCGFVPSLVRLHPRYGDFACVPVEGTGCLGGNTGEAAPDVCIVPVLKLSQLTALAIEQALPELWRYQAASSASSKPLLSIPPPSAPANSWLTDRAARIARSGTESRTMEPESSLFGVFADGAKLSICCDYQIPKALRAAGLLVYDDHLAGIVDRHVLLLPGSAEEVSIRVATLIAAERLLQFLNTPPKQQSSLARELGATAAEEPGAPAQLPGKRLCSVIHLDYALWYVGRYMLPSEARHHLCRTIMY
ncbi:conserved hypothetical protein [Leishmania mexicana MHOM/GT/2001/U1103]|uniref:Queuosine 5'-phosphate N-glycosylase/hydrolase n=1 Tax=Leishmania mexicana (strain MHOM/GT/2001/U1103) TaxID=929439 RepID=E9AST9_LEIMU|nr:conserved hypothetical protein [Leishmania mexicana MHOM/GT/2001/U1103]CBZ26013.1 conserved hypothetical protein [Leishmania mexicana MHOM/GT/2001/U1103]